MIVFSLFFCRSDSATILNNHFFLTLKPHYHDNGLNKYHNGKNNGRTSSTVAL